MNSSKEYQETIAPIVAQLKTACRKAGIPFIFVGLTESEEKSYKYETEHLSPTVLNVDIYKNPDIISNCMKLFNGYTVSLIKNYYDASDFYDDDVLDEEEINLSDFE